MKTPATHRSRPSYWGRATTFIFQHRGMARLMTRRRPFVRALLTAGVLTVLWLLLLPAVSRLWGHLLAFGRTALHLPGRTIMALHPLAGDAVLGIPYLELTATAPTPALLWGTIVVTVLGFAVTCFLPKHRVPLIYFLRAVLGIQSTAILFFVFWAEHYPYTLPEYLHGMTTVSLAVVSLVPFVLGFTYYIMDFFLVQKVLLTACILGHAVLFIPLQYLMQGYLIHHYSLLFMPLLYLLGGLPLNVMIFIALYGWGMSWVGRTTEPSVTPIRPPRTRTDPVPAC